jgi:hypothetical protein
MKLGLILSPLLVASLAHAQAPGDYEIAAPGMTPESLPVSPAPAPVRRLSLGLGIGFVDLAPHSGPVGSSAQFDIAQLSIRYLATRHLEIELGLSGGREVVGEMEGDREVSQAVLALRWRFNPHRHWNWWVMAGMGSLAVTRVGASDDVRNHAQQSTLQFGAGLEHRWERFAIQAEMRAVGVAPNESHGGAPSPTMPRGPSLDDPWQGKAGGQFALSGNYYF